LIKREFKGCSVRRRECHNFSREPSRNRPVGAVAGGEMPDAIGVAGIRHVDHITEP